MASKSKGEPPAGPKQGGYEPLTADEFKRLVAEAQEKGEPTTPLVKRLVLTTIDEVAEKLGDYESSDED